jgi:hypothetical protein
MKSLQQLCEPRDSVFDSQRRDTVLDLTDLINDRIKPDEFFDENYITEGMKTLLDQGFRRLEGKSSQGVFKLKQAMGGGKTHNLLALGLLAKHPEFRAQVMGNSKPDSALGSVKVVAFSGRESDAPYGVWGSIAEQMGKKDLFKDLYSPLQAPGQKAWESLLAGETVLILLDELPPYLENARSKQIGNSDLGQVTATALSNLLVAVGREGCENVCLVITDLTGAYEQGSAVLSDLEKETHRTAMTLEPVRMNSDELYHILRTRLFEKLPHDSEINAIAQGYAQAIRDARQMDITNESPEQFATRIQAAYPFHPALRDLYARFRENPGFQQTRGLIRLMRIVVSRLWQTDAADRRYLINAYDLDFNDPETLSELAQINSSLENAIAHDIADQGNAVAETMDANLGSTDTRDAARLLFMASLANVPNAVLGLSIPELVAYLAEPGRDVSRLQDDVLAKYATAAWYLHSTRDGKLFYRNVQNLNAKLESLVGAYNPEQAIRELREQLQKLFQPQNNWCYQRVLPLPAADEIELEQDRVTLVITEPRGGGGLRPELHDFYNQTTLQNRVAFLTGPRDTYATLIDTGKRLKAIQHILGELAAEKLPDSDPQMIQAHDLHEKILHSFRSAVRETFTSLWYPLGDGLLNADFLMEFTGNRYNGEEQIVKLLEEKLKFTRETSGDIFRKKCEQRLFTAQVLPWREIKLRAATNPAWNWHHPSALEELKADCLKKDIWREEGGFIDKGPFPQPRTSVTIIEGMRDADSGEATLRITPVNGDVVYYDVGGQATTASAKLDGGILRTTELRVSFLAVDSTGVHETGSTVPWTNRITLKHRFFDGSGGRKLELRAAPPAAIRYTTDGSDPKVAGATYDGPLPVPDGAQFVLAYAEEDGILSDVERYAVPTGDGDIKAEIDKTRPTDWSRRHAFNSTRDTYEFLERLKKYEATASGVSLTISGEGGDQGWAELQFYEHMRLAPEQIEKCLEAMREVQTSGQVRLTATEVHIPTGQALLDWVEEIKGTLKSGDFRQ